MNFAAIVGHTSERPGAGLGSYTEHAFNMELSEHLSCIAAIRGHDFFIIEKDNGEKDTYKVLANGLSILCSVELHCNAFDEKTSGTETLYINTPENKRLAEILCKHASKALSRPKARGAKSLGQFDRGYANLNGLDAPACILEPFFIDNIEDCLLGRGRICALAESILAACVEWGADVRAF